MAFQLCRSNLHVFGRSVSTTEISPGPFPLHLSGRRVCVISLSLLLYGTEEGGLGSWHSLWRAGIFQILLLCPAWPEHFAS